MKTTTLSQFQNKFNSVFEKSNNQKFLVDSELNAILNYVNTIPNYGSFRKQVKPAFENKTTQIFELETPSLLRSLFNESFNQFMMVGNYNPERLHSDTDEMFLIKEETTKQSYEFSEYYKWLNELLTTRQKGEKKNKLNHKEKMLALYYLGLDMRKFGNNVQSANILSKIIDFDESNTKRYLTYFDGKECEVKKEPNITKMLELFEHQDFKDIHNKITKDLEK